jgi:hypothetical protein
MHGEVRGCSRAGGQGINKSLGLNDFLFFDGSLELEIFDIAVELLEVVAEIKGRRPESVKLLTNAAPDMLELPSNGREKFSARLLRPDLVTSQTVIGFLEFIPAVVRIRSIPEAFAFDRYKLSVAIIQFLGKCFAQRDVQAIKSWVYLSSRFGLPK